MRRALRLLLLGALLAPLLPAGGPASAQDARTLRTQVSALRDEVARAGAELEAGTRAVEQAQQELHALTGEQFDAARTFERARREVTRAQRNVDALARSAYKTGGLPPTVTAVLSGDPAVLADLARVQSAVRRTGAARAREVAAVADEAARGEQALDRAEQLRREGLARRAALTRDLQALDDRAVALQQRLGAQAAALEDALDREAEQARVAEAARRAAAAASAAASSVASASAPLPPGPDEPAGRCAPWGEQQHVNGFLPPSVLCPVPGGGLLRTDAARAFTALSRAHLAARGTLLCVTDSYRDYAGQVDVFRRKPELAAVPGRSNHGWGLAVDLCGGVESFEGAAHAWLQANAGRYGWKHPAWAAPGGSKPEPWHWEYGG